MLYDRLINRQAKMSVIGLGYVGMPIAVGFSRWMDVIGFDIDPDKILMYQSGKDPTKEVGDHVIAQCGIAFTSDSASLSEAMFHIVTVPTPVKQDKTPDLSPIKEASRILGRHLKKGAVVVYESTVYPGVTEELCVPILEENSGMVCGIDFKVGYSPERINPGDKEHRLENIVKIISGMDGETLDLIERVYSLVVKAGVYRAQSIKVAEAAKVIENSQRDINIAFVNELSIIFNKMGIDTKAVLEAASTKWNFLNFYPGLVGGHCIGVDPYYLTYKAAELGYNSQIILAGRRINDEIGTYVAENVVKQLIKADVNTRTAKVAILGFTFKGNCPDPRNTRVIDIINELREYGIEPIVADPIADAGEVADKYGIALTDMSNICDMDAVVVTVCHDAFAAMTVADFEHMYKQAPNSSRVFVDVKGIFDRGEFSSLGYRYWRL